MNVKRVLSGMVFFLLAAWVASLGTLAVNWSEMKQDMVRLHVVGASNTDTDQAIKLQVRDAVLERLRPELEHDTDAQQVRDWIATHLSQIEETANAVLASSGCTATATLETEKFPRRVYDTFSLPAGVYDALRITIGEGQGRNWWCVVFPSLCVPETVAGFEDVAAGAGFSGDLADTLTGDYQVRFFLLDFLGQVENFLYRE